MAQRLAVVLFNLGGPDGPADVQPFLQNLFSDPAIIRVPTPARWFLARLISLSRKRSAIANYAKMGGGSPLKAETRKQAEALEAELARRGVEAKSFLAMRYWKPFAKETVAAVKAWGPERIVLLPLYPQFSTTTTASSLKSWTEAGGAPAAAVCCYPTAPKFVAAHARKILETWAAAGKPPEVRLLLSAHGLPEMIVKAGDPYQWQVEQTAAALRPLLPPEFEIEICYQSRVGRLVWIGPPTEEAVKRAAIEGKTILVAPIAFVSEHIETLVELDEDYRHIAEASGAARYLRAPALGVEAGFIATLADLTLSAASDPDLSPRSDCGHRICPASWRDCPNRRAPPPATPV